MVTGRLGVKLFGWQTLSNMPWTFVQHTICVTAYIYSPKYWNLFYFLNHYSKKWTDFTTWCYASTVYAMALRVSDYPISTVVHCPCDLGMQLAIDHVTWDIWWVLCWIAARCKVQPLQRHALPQLAILVFSNDVSPKCTRHVTQTSVSHMFCCTNSLPCFNSRLHFYDV